MFSKLEEYSVYGSPFLLWGHVVRPVGSNHVFFINIEPVVGVFCSWCARNSCASMLREEHVVIKHGQTPPTLESRLFVVPIQVFSDDSLSNSGIARACMNESHLLQPKYACEPWRLAALPVKVPLGASFEVRTSKTIELRLARSRLGPPFPVSRMISFTI